MKTNHRRGYVEEGSHRFRYGLSLSSKLSGAKAFSLGGDATNGHRGEARDRRGAKKYIRTRDRIANKQIAKDGFNGEE